VSEGTRAATGSHRAQQLLLRAATISALRRLWPLVDWSRVDESFPGFLTAAAALITRNRATSAGLSARYLRVLRRAAGIPGEPVVVLAGPVPAAQLAASLRVSTVVAVKNAATAGTPPVEAMAAALTLAEGAAARLVLDGGRDTVTATVRGDRAAVGFQRVLGGAGCDFCRMLADRGAVYKEATADFLSHDRCGCTPEPVYR
jgi:hypothetical protein